MAKIIDRVIEKREKIKNDAQAASENQKKSVAAIIGGIKSKPWKDYMSQFVDPADPSQLMRLLGTDGTADNPKFDLKRAYLVANGTCGEPTTKNLAFNVDGIDDPA